MGSLCENTTSSTKQEVHNVSQRRQRGTKPRLYRQDAHKFGEVRLCVMQTDGETDILVTIFRSPLRERSNDKEYTECRLSVYLNSEVEFHRESKVDFRTQLLYLFVAVHIEEGCLRARRLIFFSQFHQAKMFFLRSLNNR